MAFLALLHWARLPHPGGRAGKPPSAVDAHLAAAALAAGRGDRDTEFPHLERAHILAQSSTGQHVRVHWRMLRLALRHRAWLELLGQIPRIFGAAVLTAPGLVPKGNTGGTNVSMFRPLPIPADLAALMSPTSFEDDRDGERA
jgi:hypothetical protein